MTFAPWAQYLSDRQREALHDASVVALEWCFDDLQLVGERDPEQVELEDTAFFEWALPAAQAHLYTVGFLQRFTVAVATVGWKLAQRDPPRLSCVAEELALRALIIQADGWMQARGWPAEDFGDFRQEVFEDLDVEYLFDPGFDGVGEDEVGKRAGIAPQGFEDWFKPFGAGSRGQPHPFCTDE